MLDAIPTERPITPLLDSIDETEKLRELDVDQLDTLARELREFLLYSVGKTGGHFGAGLGVVELFTSTFENLGWSFRDKRIVSQLGFAGGDRLFELRQFLGETDFLGGDIDRTRELE